MSTTIKLTGVTWDHPRAYDCLLAASDAFERRSGISISWVKRSLQAFADEPIDQLAQQHDLIVLDHPHVGQIAETGCLRPLPPLADEAVASMGGSLESYVWSGQQWAYPIDASCQMAVTRTDHADVLPQHWEELLQPTAAHRGLLTPLQPVDAFDAMLTLIASRGDNHLPVDPLHFCSQANGELALRILKALYRLGPAQATTWNPIKVLEVLSTQDEFVASPCLFGYVNYVKPGFRTHRLTYRNLPVFADAPDRRSILGGAGLGISSSCAQPEAAEEFVSWLASMPIQSGLYVQNEGQPAHRASWLYLRHDPNLNGFFQGAFDTMDTAWTRPRDPWFLHFVDDVCAVFPDFFTKDQNEASFLEQLQKLYRHHIGTVSSPTTSGAQT